MLAASLLSGALLLFPIAITVGIYIGIEFQKIFNSGFEGTYGVPTGNSGSATPGGNGIQTSMYCQKLIGITPKGSRYTCELFSEILFCDAPVPAVVGCILLLQLIRFRSLVVWAEAQTSFSC
jgi:hypothetical protein